MTNPEQSVIDSIDALIDEQLDAGEPETGYDYDYPDYPDCWRCGYEWHGLAYAGCPGSAVEGPELPNCGHCNAPWHIKAVDARGCPGSTFIGPWWPAWKRIADPWILPDNPLDASEWTRDPIAQFAQSPYTAPRPTCSELISNLMTMMGDLTWTARRWLTPYRYDGRHDITHRFIDEVSDWGNLRSTTSWVNPFLPKPFENHEPRPWLYLPRSRVIPAYTVEHVSTVKLLDGEFRCTGEIQNHRITGTIPEYVDATIDTLGQIPAHYLDPEQLKWALTHRTIADGRPYAHGRDFYIGVGARIGWDNGNGNIWIGTVTEEPRRTPQGWSFTLGGHQPAHAEPPVGESVTALADAWHRRTMAEQQRTPMWAVDPGRSRRHNTRRRHR